MSNNIVITGEGIVSAIGMNKEEVLRSLIDGKTGIKPMRILRSAHKELPVGEVNMSNEEMMKQLGIDTSSYTSRTTLMGILSVRQAIQDASVPQNNEGLRIILISGTSVGGMDITENYFGSFKQTDEHIECLKKHNCGSCTQDIADYFDIFNEVTTISTACSSAANAIILGARLLDAGEADIVVAGGTEALTRFHLNGFNSLMVLDNNICRPFDENRNGLNLGEGAAFVVLEREETAVKRNVAIHAYLSGYGNACDAFHQTASSENGEGAYLAMSEAIKMAGLKPEDIQYVNAHGTGTENNDRSESAALRRVFNDSLPYISSTKAFTGHTTSASGSIETVICILAINNHFIPGNLGWEHQMPNGIIPTLGMSEVSINHVLCNSFGFGGNDSSLVISHKRASRESNNDEQNRFEMKIISQVEIINEEDLCEIRDYISPIESRRMGKLLKGSLLASLKAMEKAGVKKPDAIITATAFGCVENSELLLNQMEEEGEVMLKPTCFMQSTHNTLGSNIAIFTKCHGYNVTYTQGDDSLAWALRDAEMLLKGGKYKTILVGAHDESTPLLTSLMDRLGIHKEHPLTFKSMIVSC